jgi:GTPase Era involved in 16S rRNA processing
MIDHQELRVLVFGSTGTGKTSLCNSITNTDQKRPVNDSAKGVTFESFTFPAFELSKKMCIITDTVGLNESDKGTVPSKDALKSLVNLLKASKEGYNLLIQVMRMPRITKDVEDNYRFFVETIAEKKIPVILVVTGCENVEPMSKWATDNEQTFEEMDLEYKAIISTCFAEGGRLEAVYQSLREDSVKDVQKAIKVHSSFQPIKLYEGSFGLMFVIKRAWNWLCHFLKLPSEWEIVVNEALENLLIRLGLTKKEARDLAEEWNKS